MSDTKFTPGPWHTFRNFPAEDGTYVLFGNISDDDEDGENDNHIAHVTNDKDAYLIAAAPEMYGALERILMVTNAGSRARDLAIEALKKARGE